MRECRRRSSHLCRVDWDSTVATFQGDRHTHTAWEWQMDKEKLKMLGTLVDRAVCMPYTKPKDLTRPRQSIIGDIQLASDFLHRCFSQPENVGLDDLWSDAHLVADPAGPFWDDTVRDFYRLPETDRAWVLEKLRPTVIVARDALYDAAREEDYRWTSLMSQPQLLTPGKRVPSITRPDLIVGLGGKRIDLIDLKTTSSASRKYSGKFEQWKTTLETLGFSVV